uniref:Uncharacterized protein n=1 Tax=Leptobrachium leishanense TaxID=445787 RepID=A0A8C5PB17_9ANUR
MRNKSTSILDFTGFPPSIATSSGNLLPSVLVFSFRKFRGIVIYILYFSFNTGNN